MLINHSNSSFITRSYLLISDSSAVHDHNSLESNVQARHHPQRSTSPLGQICIRQWFSSRSLSFSADVTSQSGRIQSSFIKMPIRWKRNSATFSSYLIFLTGSSWSWFSPAVAVRTQPKWTEERTKQNKNENNPALSIPFLQFLFYENSKI